MDRVAELADTARAFASLPGLFQQLLFARYAIGLQYHEVAEDFGMSTTTVRTYCVSGIQHMADYLNKYESERNVRR